MRSPAKERNGFVSYLLSDRGRRVLWISGALTVGICLVMNLFLIPAIERSTGGIRCFDMNFGYSYETAQAFLSRLSQESRAVYLRVQLPLDFVYPLCYFVFFSALLLRLRRRALLAALPAALAVLDYAENICTVLMLRGETLPPALAATAAAFTVCKTLLMYACFALIVVFGLLWLLHRKKTARRDPS